MQRRLTAHERALWSRVAATVRPIGGKAAAPSAPPPPLPPAPMPRLAPRPEPRSGPPPRTLYDSPKAAPVAAATLDGGWDRRLRQGDIRPDRVIDLHGHTLDAAYQVLVAALDSAEMHGHRVLLIVTGKGRTDRPSRIRAELSHWLDSGAHRSRIAALRGAHPRHGGGGAFYLILRRRP